MIHLKEIERYRMKSKTLFNPVTNVAGLIILSIIVSKQDKIEEISISNSDTDGLNELSQNMYINSSKQRGMIGVFDDKLMVSREEG